MRLPINYLILCRNKSIELIASTGSKKLPSHSFTTHAEQISTNATSSPHSNYSRSFSTKPSTTLPPASIINVYFRYIPIGIYQSAITSAYLHFDDYLLNILYIHTHNSCAVHSSTASSQYRRRICGDSEQRSVMNVHFKYIPL